MLILSLLLIVLLLSLVLGAAFLLGGDHQAEELERIRTESRLAERQLHDLTKAAFVAMVEEADARRRRS